MKKNKKSKLKLNRIILVLLIIVSCIFLAIKFCMSLIEENINGGFLGSTIASITDTISGKPQYTVIKEDTNENYAGKRKRKSFSEKMDILLLSQL